MTDERRTCTDAGAGHERKKVGWGDGWNLGAGEYSTVSYSHDDFFPRELWVFIVWYLIAR